MPHWVVGRLAEALDRRAGKGLSARTRPGARARLQEGHRRHPREPGASRSSSCSRRAGRAVAYHDPHVPVVPPTRAHARLAGRPSVPLEPAAVAGYDAVVALTDHRAVDWAALAAHARLLVDTRGVTRGIEGERDNIASA